MLEEEREDPGCNIALLKTRYYSAFTRENNVSIRRAPRVYGNASKGKNRERPTSDDTNETYKVGDTVLVRTTSNVLSIAVIVAVLTVAEEGCLDKHGCRVMVHWFIRPNELPTVRARRDNKEVCAPSTLPMHCTNRLVYVLESSTERDILHVVVKFPHPTVHHSNNLFRFLQQR